jgi:hypothetical protein
MSKIVAFPNVARARSSSEERLACYARDQAFAGVAAALERLSKSGTDLIASQLALQSLSSCLLQLRHYDQRRFVEDAMDEVFERARRLVLERSHSGGHDEELPALELYLAYANLRGRLMGLFAGAA